MTGIRRLLAASLLAAAVIAAPPAAAGGPAEITLTFVRHAQSEGNASGLIDTSTPGPSITELGRTQAAESAAAMAGDDYDGVYASTMVRTQQTAAPMAAALAEPVVVLPGLREVEAGQSEGRPEVSAADYFDAPAQWLSGDRAARIPGSIDGNEFDARFDASVQQIYDSGDVNDHALGDHERRQPPPRIAPRAPAAQHRPGRRHRQSDRWVDADRLERRTAPGVTPVTVAVICGTAQLPAGQLRR